MESQSNLRPYAVWDRTTRWFHWINVICVPGLAVIGLAILYNKPFGVSDEGKILLKTIHVWIGYVFLANLAWRLVWGFLGGPYARWRRLLPGGAGYGDAVRAYLKGIGSSDGPRYLGHNPVGRIAVTALLALLVVQAATGLVLAGTDIFYPPFGAQIASWIAAPGVDPASLVPYDKTLVDEAAYEAMRDFRSPFKTVHYWTFWLLCVGIAVHVLAVVMTEIREGGALISAMFTGRKHLDREPVDAPPKSPER